MRGLLWGALVGSFIGAYVVVSYGRDRDETRDRLAARRRRRMARRAAAGRWAVAAAGTLKPAAARKSGWEAFAQTGRAALRGVASLVDGRRG